MFDFKFESMKFDFNEPCDDCYDFKFPHDEVNWSWEEVDAPDNFSSFELDHDKIYSQICAHKINEVDTLNLKDDNDNKVEVSNYENDTNKDNQVNSIKDNCGNEEEKDQSATLWTPHINIANFQIEKWENLSIKESSMEISIEAKDEDSLEHLKEIISSMKKPKGENKQSRFGRNDDRGKILKLL